MSELGLDDGDMPLEILELSILREAASAKGMIRSLPIGDDEAVIRVVAASSVMSEGLVAHPRVRASNAHRVRPIVFTRELTRGDAVPPILHIADSTGKGLFAQAG